MLNKKPALFTYWYDGGKRRHISHNELSSYELTSVPRYFADAGGEQLSATRTNLFHILTDKADYLSTARWHNMFDAMPDIQSLTPQSSSKHLALQTFKLTHQVVDIYRIISLKRFERARQDDITDVSEKSSKWALRCGSHLEELLSPRIYTWTDDNDGIFAQQTSVFGRTVLY